MPLTLDERGFYEVDFRQADGGNLMITLKQHEQTKVLLVEMRYSVRRESEREFDILVSDPADAHEAYWHPFAYAARTDVVTTPPGGYAPEKPAISSRLAPASQKISQAV